jgi:hypothetical protein
MRSRCCLVALLLCVAAGPSVTAQQSASAGSDVALRGVMIPTGFQNAKYSAMIQVAVDGSPLPNATWDLDVSFLAGRGTPEQYSGRVVGGEPGTPVVFEVQVEFDPGHYELTLSARETTAGQSATRELDDRWADPDRAKATISPIVLLQPAQGAFLRGESTRGQGALAIGDEGSMRIDLPAAVVMLVCRGATTRETVRVVRKLKGASTFEFETIDLEPGHDPCAQVRDIIRPGTLGPGFFSYEVSLVTGSGQIASAERKFAAGKATHGNRPGS